MSKHFLSRELIVSEAFRMIDEKGTDDFSVRGLAAHLDVQVSSLYNHIDNEYDLLMEVAKRAAALYAETIGKAVEGMPQHEAAFKAGDACRVFIKEHRYLYDLLLDRRWIGDPEFEKVSEEFTQPIYFLMPENVRNSPQRDHLYVTMRVVTHGFGSLESLGIFDRLSVDPTESYHMMIKSVLDMMDDMSKSLAEKSS